MMQGNRRQNQAPPEYRPYPSLRFPDGPSSTTSGIAIASLVLGIVSFFTGPFAAIPAIICGHMAIKEVSASGDRLTGTGLAIGGLVTGYVSTLLFACGAFYVFYVRPAEEKKIVAELNKSALQMQEQISEMFGRAAPIPLPSQKATFRVPIYPPASPPQPRNTQGPDFTEQIEHNESAVVAALKELAQDQQTSFKLNGRYIGNLNSFALPIEGSVYSGYTFNLMVLSSSFRITATPVAPRQSGLHSFYIDESGVVRANPNGKASKDDMPFNPAL